MREVHVMRLVYINWQNLEKIRLNFTIEIQFCTICPKLFIFRERVLFLNFGVKCETAS